MLPGYFKNNIKEKYNEEFTLLFSDRHWNEY